MAFDESCASASTPESASYPTRTQIRTQIAQSISTLHLVAAVTNTIITTTKLATAATSTIITTTRLATVATSTIITTTKLATVATSTIITTTRLATAVTSTTTTKSIIPQRIAPTNTVSSVFTHCKTSAVHTVQQKCSTKSAAWTAYMTAHWYLRPVSCA